MLCCLFKAWKQRYRASAPHPGLQNLPHARPLLSPPLSPQHTLNISVSVEGVRQTWFHSQPGRCQRRTSDGLLNHLEPLLPHLRSGNGNTDRISTLAPGPPGRVIRSFSKHALSAYCVPSPRKLVVAKTDRTLSPQSLQSSGEMDIEKTGVLIIDWLQQWVHEHEKQHREPWEGSG